MKKFFIALVIGLATIGLILLIISISKKQRTSSIKPEKFCISNTNAISKIQITNSNTVTLTKNNNLWLVNTLVPAKTSKINQLLSTIENLQIKAKVPDDAIVQVREQLYHATQVNIFEKHKLLKSFFLGEPLPDTSGNYIMESGDLIPYIASLPDKKINLLKYFSSNFLYWANDTFLMLKPQQINTLSIIYPDTSKSFILLIDSTSITYKHCCKKQKLTNPDTAKLYINQFCNLPALSYIQDPVLTDSLASAVKNKSYTWALLIQTPQADYNLFAFKNTEDTTKLFAIFFKNKDKLTLLLNKKFYDKLIYNHPKFTN